MKVRPCLEINLYRILENYLTFCRAANPSTQMAAVIKDNAYGLGAEQVADILYRRGGCRVFFVAHGFEGHQVRPYVPEADIYVLQGPGEEDIDYFFADSLIPVISSPAQLRFWNQVAPASRPKAIQVESGLNRLGFRRADMLALSEAERACFSVVLSHLACADEPAHPMNEKQLNAFREIQELFPGAKFSLAASDGFLIGNKYCFNIVRLGAVLYGINPIEYARLKSQNVIRVTAPILQVTDVNPGDCVGYGADYHVTQKGKIAIVSIGYGDGVFRSFFPRGKVWIQKDSRRFPAPMVGRVSMDNLICDVSQIPEDVLNTAEYAILIDDDYTVDDFGADAGTIGYEVLSAIGHGIRYIRTYCDKF